VPTDLPADRVRVEIVDSVATVTMTRPPVNAVDRVMLDALTRVFTEPAQLARANVVVITGAGRCFSAGHDRNQRVLVSRDAAAEHFRAANRCVEALTASQVPTIAAVHGAAIGVGLILAASCTVAVFAADAVLQLPERQVGIAAGAAHVHRLLPPGWARWLALTGERVLAGDLSGAIPVVPAADLHATAVRVATDIAHSKPALGRLLAAQLSTPGLTKAYADELEASLPLLADPRHTD
jgi:enoyl-CoA hydratase